jgi:hypothetical protein
MKIKASHPVICRIRDGKPVSVSHARAAVRFCAFICERVPDLAASYARDAMTIAPYAVGRRRA